MFTFSSIYYQFSQNNHLDDKTSLPGGVYEFFKYYTSISPLIAELVIRRFRLIKCVQAQKNPRDRLFSRFLGSKSYSIKIEEQRWKKIISYIFQKLKFFARKII